MKNCARHSIRVRFKNARASEVAFKVFAVASRRIFCIFDIVICLSGRYSVGFVLLARLSYSALAYKNEVFSLVAISNPPNFAFPSRFGLSIVSLSDAFFG